MNRFLYIFGQPGSGKTTLVNAICSRACLLYAADDPIKHEAYTWDGGVFSVLGRKSEPFGGTDRLSYVASKTAATWLAKLSNCAAGKLVIGEGDRLANSHVFSEIRNLYSLQLFYMDCSNDEAKKRRMLRAEKYKLKLQNQDWVKGRITKHKNLLNSQKNVQILNANLHSNDLADIVWSCLTK